MQCKVPLIINDSDDARLDYADAAVYSELTEKPVAEKMLLLQEWYSITAKL